MSEDNFTLKHFEKRRLRAHFGFSSMPFSPQARAHSMFASQSQRELRDGLLYWSEVRGIALISGSAGVGKSISIRRFIQELDDNRYHVFDFSYLPLTTNGFLRSFNRALGTPVSHRSADLFDGAKAYLGSFEQDHGPHPIFVIDDGEGLRPETLDILKRLTCYELDSQPRFSLLLAGTEELLETVRWPQATTLRSRITFTYSLRPFGYEDTQNYIHHRLQKASADPKLFSDEAIRRIFQASKGVPRAINQLATQAMITAAICGNETLDAQFLTRVIREHPLYNNEPGARP